MNLVLILALRAAIRSIGSAAGALPYPFSAYSLTAFAALLIPVYSLVTVRFSRAIGLGFSISLSRAAESGWNYIDQMHQKEGHLMEVAFQ